MSADEVLSIDPERYKTNADLILAAAEMGYLTGRTLDATYGKGGFWTKYRPKELVTNDWDPTMYVEHNHDFRALPGHWEATFDTTVLDPPYKLDGTPQDRGPGEANLLYGVGAGAREYESVDAVDQLYIDGLRECYRVTKPKGYVLCKVMDQVSGSRTRWESWKVANLMHTLGARYVTSFFLIGSRKQPDGRTQVNPRNNYSQLMVFQTGRKK
jgi:hypothetical protein